MENLEFQIFTFNKFKLLEEKLENVEAIQKKMLAKCDYLDDRLRTQECNSIHMEEKDLKASSKIKSGLDPMRDDIFTLKTCIRQIQISIETQKVELKKNEEKNFKRTKGEDKKEDIIFCANNFH